MTKVFVVAVIFVALFASTECFVNTRLSKYNVTSNGTSDLEHLAITWPNGSTIVLNFTKPLSTKSKTVDCFGLGQTVSNFLEWWFSTNNESANVLDVRFFLSSRNQRKRVQVLPGRQFGLEWTDFRIERRTVFIVHGFLSHGSETWIKQMEQALLQWVNIMTTIRLSIINKNSSRPFTGFFSYAYRTSGRCQCGCCRLGSER